LVAGIPARLATFGVIRGPEAQEHRLNIAVSLFLRGLQRANG
jgi:hypothetical protein